MKARTWVWLWALLLALTLGGCGWGSSLPGTADYQYQTPTADGIGKVYYGREIAQVMGHEGAYWLERPSREMLERPGQLVAALGLAPNAVVADIGAGTGYVAVRLAAAVPQGRVLAVDVQPEMVAMLQERSASQGIANLEPIQGEAADPHLPPATVDLALMVDAYHEFEFPREMMAALRRAVKPGGQVVLAEYRGESPWVLIKGLHKMRVSQVQRELAGAGFRWLKTDDSLPQQHLIFFENPGR